MTHVHHLHVPTNKVLIQGLGKDRIWHTSGSDVALELIVSDLVWLEWSAYLQLYNSDKAWFIADSTGILLYLGEFASKEEMLSRISSAAPEGFQYNGLAHFLVDADVVSEWLINNPSQFQGTPMSTDGDPWSINKFSFAHLASGIGSNDQTPLNRPFTADSPQFHFTLGGIGGRQYRLRYEETREEGKPGCWAMFQDGGDPNRPGDTNRPYNLGYFTIFSSEGVEAQFTDHDEMEEMKDAIKHALARAFADYPGGLVQINFQESDSDEEFGTVFFIYPEDRSAHG